MSDPNDPSQTDLDTASSRIDADKTLSQLANMLPRVLASDERDARRYQALQRYWRGVHLSKPDISQELKAFLIHLGVQLSQSTAGLHKVLSTSARALVYIERATFYALQDFSREFEHHPETRHIQAHLSDIHRDVRAWCKSETRDNGQVLVTAIQKTLENALQHLSVDRDDHTETNSDAQR